MESTRARACPSCGAASQAPQRWCLECGAELPQQRRSGLRPAVSIATTLAVLVGAASAGGYTLLAHDKQPPPPTTTIAQQLPATTPTPTEPATQQPSYTPSSPSSPTTLPSTSRLPGGSRPLRLPRAPSHSALPHLIDPSHGSVQPVHRATGTTTPKTPAPQLALTNVALGATAVVYAPYASNDVDLGDPSQVVDGTTHTVWSTPTFADPTARPQLGIYVDLASAQKLRKLVLETPTPGISIELYGAVKDPPAAITDSGWDHIASRGHLKRKTTIGLPSHALRYVLVWIVGLPPRGDHAAISELSLLGLQPE